MTEVTVPAVDGAKCKVAPNWLSTLRTRKRKIVESISILCNLPNLYYGQKRDHDAVVRALQGLTSVMNQMQARLRWYENRVPMLRKEYIAFKAHEAKLVRAEMAKQELAGSPVASPDETEVPATDHPSAEMGVAG